ncbi:MAG: hypothetical protein G3M70_16225 [Candidatus Nitronauta litoralis]|uniref:Flagellar hook-length control protein FliK n=1 Tax=Candidatus Nitronauta litoralis TaxID=2705533 RepID=A0A7T0BYL9_9BACT|nr:MAG: hypothetical protein G3M70_16225 [Candidatus Nitronauta litoralis]
MVPEFNSAESLRIIFQNDPSLKVQTLKLASLDQFIKNFVPGQVVSGKVIDQLSSGKNLVELNGHRAAVEFNQPQSPGRSFQVRVEQLSPTPIFKLLEGTVKQKNQNPSAIKGSSKASAGLLDHVKVSNASQKTLPSPPVYSLKEISAFGLTPDNQVPGRLNLVIDSNTVQVSLRGREVTLFHSNTALLEGTELSIKAEPKGDGFILAVRGSENQNPALKLLQSLLPGRQPLTQLIKDFEGAFFRLSESEAKTIPNELKSRLQETLNVLKAVQSEPVEAKAIRENIARTGASFESRLSRFLENPTGSGLKQAVTQDFKGQLQELSRVLEKRFGAGIKTGDGTFQSLGRQTQAIIQNLDIHQLTQVVARQENHPMSLMIPNMLEPQGRPIKVFYREDGDDPKSNKTEGKKKYTLVFFLELSQLGNVRLDARVQNKTLGLNVAVENEEVLGFVKDGFEIFQKQLKEMGFESEINGQVNPEKIQEPIDELPEGVFKSLSSLVDVRT